MFPLSLRTFLPLPLLLALLPRPQRYVENLPSGGELVLFDRSYYNRAGVERVMGFAKEDEVELFFR